MAEKQIIFDIVLEDGKYRFLCWQEGDERTMQAYRHGEQWPAGVEWLIENRFSKSFMSLMQELHHAYQTIRTFQHNHPTVIEKQILRGSGDEYEMVQENMNILLARVGRQHPDGAF